jgi:GNAT superfamily N-acetyltransferase
MVEVRLVPMNKKEFEVMREAGVKRYAEENVKVGYWAPGEAMRCFQETHDQLLADGMSTKGHHFYKAMDAEDDKVVGHVWVRVEPGKDRRGFILDVFIDEEWRGEGYGKAMMINLEAKARRMKLSSPALHVFAYNEVARHLYGSMGYELKSLNLMKDL